MPKVPVINLVLDSMLPENMRDRNRSLDKKGIDALMTRIAREQPDLYPKVAQFLSEAGANLAYERGETFRLDDFKAPAARERVLAAYRKDREEFDRKGLEGPARSRGLLELMGRYSEMLALESEREALSKGNNIAMTVLSGARGKRPQLRDMISSPGFYVDADGDPIPWFVERSFAEGLSPADWLAGTYGARGAVTESKNAVAQGGFLAKTLARVNADNYVTARDCGTTNGIDLPPDEKDLRGRVLQRETAGFPAGTVITREVRNRIVKNGKPVIVRSPMTCQQEKGICARCMGVGSDGAFPKLGSHVGITASNAEGEPLAQCLVEGTEVLMADFTTKPIEKLRPGDMVMGADIDGNTFPDRVLALIDQGPQDCEEFEFRMGSTKRTKILKSTACHKILSNEKNWSRHNFVKFKGEFGYGCPADFQASIKEAGRVKKGFAAVLPVGCDVSGPDEPCALMVGFHLGDGSRVPGESYSPVVSCAEPSLVGALNTELSQWGLRMRKNKRSHDWNIAIPREDYASGKTRTNAVKKVLNRLGLMTKYAHEKRIPREVWGWSQKSVCDLIAGYVAADGCVFGTDDIVMLSFGSTSKGLLEDLRDLLEQRLGIYGGTIGLACEAGKNSYVHDAWQFKIIRLDQVEKFASLIKIPDRKGEELTQALARREGKKRHLEPFFRARRVTRRPIGRIQCWDISVANKDHLFVLANGLIVSNSSLNMKHVVSASGPGAEYSGLDYLTQFTESPEEFKNRSLVSETAGIVGDTREAPQGGSYIRVGEDEFYVPPERTLMVKKGDQVEAGDALTDGLIDPEDVIRLKGLGAGRRYYADKLKEISAASGADMDRRNFEVLARTAVNFVRLEDPIEEGYLPDDVVPFNKYLHARAPRKDVRKVSLRDAKGLYLEQPALHFTPGTKLTKGVIDKLGETGFGEVFVSTQEPEFEPTMVRLQSAAAVNDDWLARMGGSYLTRNLEDSKTRALDTNILSNSHPVPRMAVGVGFGDKLDSEGVF